MTKRRQKTSPTETPAEPPVAEHVIEPQGTEQLAEAEPQAAEYPTEGRRGLGFPLVGISASAGGLEALEQFFTNMP